MYHIVRSGITCVISCQVKSERHVIESRKACWYAPVEHWLPAGNYTAVIPYYDLCNRCCGKLVRVNAYTHRKIIDRWQRIGQWALIFLSIDIIDNFYGLLAKWLTKHYLNQRYRAPRICTYNTIRFSRCMNNNNRIYTLPTEAIASVSKMTTRIEATYGYIMITICSAPQPPSNSPKGFCLNRILN